MFLVSYRVLHALFSNKANGRDNKMNNERKQNKRDSISMLKKLKTNLGNMDDQAFFAKLGTDIDILRIIKWREKHRRCRFCKFCYVVPPCGNTRCKAKDKKVFLRLPRWFCSLYVLRPIPENISRITSFSHIPYPDFDAH